MNTAENLRFNIAVLHFIDKRIDLLRNEWTGILWKKQQVVNVMRSIRLFLFKNCPVSSRLQGGIHSQRAEGPSWTWMDQA